MKKVLLVGNPNSGKTTLFNTLTRSNEHVGNWHGVTVENKSKKFSICGQDFVLVDTPGLYSLNPLSFEEKVATDTILQNHDAKIINLCDKGNLQRNLFLSLCLLEKGVNVVIAVNNIDKRVNRQINYAKLKKMLGVEIVEIDASQKQTLTVLQEAIKTPQKVANLPYFDGKFKNFDVKKQSELRYQFIDALLDECTIESRNVYGQNWFDKIALNRFLAVPVFLLILTGIFYLTFFSLGAFLSQILSDGLNLLSVPFLSWLEAVASNGWIFNLFHVAIIGGLNTILSFLPQVVLLFFFLTILEDSGYMSRIAFVFDDIFEKIGLSGKSVYTLLMGFGCSTSAIMTSRNMEDKNAKIKTALLCPYMSCSAKIPIYTIIGGAFFGAKNLFVIWGLYALGVTIAIFFAKLLDKTVLKSEKQSFILEFPPYRKTSIKRIFKILWKSIKEFAIKVGSIVITMNIVVWVLSSFSFKFEYVSNGSMLESLGRILAPIFTPLGFGNWAIASALLAGFVAKEIVVSSIAMFNGIDGNSKELIAKSIFLQTSVIFFKNKASALAFLVYCLLYTPCAASVAMLKQEVGRKWAIFSVCSQLLIAYIVALIVYNIAFAFEIFGFFLPFVVLMSICLIVCSFTFVVYKAKHGRCNSCCGSCDKICKKRKL